MNANELRKYISNRVEFLDRLGKLGVLPGKFE